MLSSKPSQRPTIVDIINKPFIKIKCVKFITDCFTILKDKLDPEDVHYPSLIEQAENLNLWNLVEKSASMNYQIEKVPQNKNIKLKEQNSKYSKMMKQLEKEKKEKEKLNVE